MSGFILPTALPVASGWQLADYKKLRLRGDAAALQVSTVEFPQLAGDELWMIDRAVASCDSTTKTTLRLYENGVDPLRVLSGTPAGNFDEAEYPTGLQIDPSTSLVAQWLGASTGARGQLLLQFRQFRRV